jgi:hypothetical protein
MRFLAQLALDELMQRGQQQSELFAGWFGVPQWPVGLPIWLTAMSAVLASEWA